MKFEVGQLVLWRGSYGNAAARLARIIERDPDSKKGKPTYVLDNLSWAYEYQLQAVPEPKKSLGR